MEMNGETQERCMEQEEEAWEEVVQQAEGTQGKIMELNGRPQEDITEQAMGAQGIMDMEGRAQEEVMEQAWGTRRKIMELDGKAWEVVTEQTLGAQGKMELSGRDWEEITQQAGGARGKIMELDGRAQKEVMEQVGGAQGKMELGGRGWEEVMQQPVGAKGKIMEVDGRVRQMVTEQTMGAQRKVELDGRAWMEVTEQAGRDKGKIMKLDGRAQAEVKEQVQENQEVGVKLVKDLLTVVATSALPHGEKMELEFVTLQFMMGGNVHLVGELQSQHIVEEFQQEMFAKFPIPAFCATNIVACNQATSSRTERGFSFHKFGCSRHQDRIYSQLIFFLCRASSLTCCVGLDRLLEMLQQLKSCIYYIPVALVGVIVQADPDPEMNLEQEVKALRWLKCLLDGVFCCDLLSGHDGTEEEVQVQVAVYQSGWPQRVLEVKRAACQAIRAALKF
ncbi:uncharacterized protein LOC112543928 [Pelodiscus sinensis]|uniref:uncharacterized protein LOC112543928 n=1 Tax=Pelodiscus sinensis TaxID=13735 RepID=UPI000D71E849|nr:uncharacterized protein LOC112543928 [Pelodiscus sinensis]|eukprot:XP_025034974.1 uncharacterized protein LOC112543928 [Pelodiscus sinensis]